MDCTVERVWAVLKKFWGKKLASIERDASAEDIDQVLEEVCEQTDQSITGEIVYSADQYNLRCIRGALI